MENEITMNEEEVRKAWDKAHRLQTDIGAMLQETDSKPYIPPKHMLDMVFKHIHKELQRIKDLIKIDN